MKRWLLRIVLVLVAAFIAVYLSDWAVYKMRGSPQSKVTVNHYISVPLKGNKQEFDYTGTDDEPCAVSLFSHGGEPTCWQLRKQANQATNL